MYMNSYELVTFVSSISCAISKCCSKEELSVLAAVFTQLGDSIATVLINEELNADCSCNSLPQEKQ